MTKLKDTATFVSAMAALLIAIPALLTGIATFARTMGLTELRRDVDAIAEVVDDGTPTVTPTPPPKVFVAPKPRHVAPRGGAPIPDNIPESASLGIEPTEPDSGEARQRVRRIAVLSRERKALE